MKGISLKDGMPFGFGGVYEKNSLYAILLGAAGPVFRLRLRVVERKRYVTSNLLKLSLSYRFQLRVTERKCCVTSNHPQIHYDFVKNYVSAEGNLI